MLKMTIVVMLIPVESLKQMVIEPTVRKTTSIKSLRNTKSTRKHKHKKSSVVDSYFEEEEAEEQNRNGKKEGEPKCESEKDYLKAVIIEDSW